MEKKNYNSLEEISNELQLLNLKRKIHLEELKLTKHQIQEDLSPVNWINTGIKAIKKYGILLLLRKIIK